MHILSYRSLFVVRYAASTALLLSCASVPAQTPESPPMVSLPPTFVQMAGGGVLVYVDPKSGKYMNAGAPEAVPLTLSAQEINAMSTSGNGLHEVAGEAAGSGVSIELRGRFQNPLVTVIDAQGKAHVHHLAPLPFNVTSGK